MRQLGGIALQGIALVLVIACGGPPAAIPWDQGVPPGGEVIYTAEHGYGSCAGFQSCPTRIVRIDDLCVTEIWSGSHWSLRESKPCGVGQ